MGSMAVSGWITGTDHTWEDYVGAAVGGAAGGEALLYAPVTGAASLALIGAGTNALGDATTQGLKNISGKQDGFDTGEFVGAGISGAIGGAVGAKIAPGIKIPGLSAGRGSLSAIVNGLTTKLSNGTISSISALSATKMALYSAMSQLLDQLSAQVAALATQPNTAGGAGQTSPASNQSKTNSTTKKK
jgi:hypothetical protein